MSHTGWRRCYGSRERRMSRPRIAALRLAARRCGELPLRAGDAAIAAGEGWPPAGGRKCRSIRSTQTNWLMSCVNTDEAVEAL
jgi:hypothetical protein